MAVAEVRGQRLFYQDSGGAGVPLVLNHGFLMDASMFDAQVRALGARHRIIAWDQRGHGRTVTEADIVAFATLIAIGALYFLLYYTGIGGIGPAK